jgi:Flp pilus assembly protein TadB
MNGADHGGERGYIRTPMVKRLPTVGSLALALVLANIIGHPLWLGLLAFLGTLVVCVLVLRFVFRQPIERLLAYQEYDDE